MNLGDQFNQIISDKMDTLPIQEVGDVFIDGVEVDTNKGIDVTGSSFRDYEPETVKRKGGQRTVTMRDRSRSIESLDNTNSMSDSNSASTRLSFSGNAGYGSSSKAAGNVFHHHQKGTAKGGKVRKIFPESGDETSENVQRKLDKVEIILAEHFNE